MFSVLPTPPLLPRTKLKRLWALWVGQPYSHRYLVMTSAESKNKHSQSWKSNISNDRVNGKKAVSGRYMCQWIYAVFSMSLQMCVWREKNCKRGITNINLLFPVWPNLAKENLVLLDRQEFIYTTCHPNQIWLEWYIVVKLKTDPKKTYLTLLRFWLDMYTTGKVTSALSVNAFNYPGER